MRNYPLQTLPTPGLNPYKQNELYSNFGPLLPDPYQEIACLKPSEEVMEMVKAENTKDIRGEIKKQKKNQLEVIKERKKVGT
jgi:hypothetical protein